MGLHRIVHLTFPILEQLKPTAESLSILLQQISCWLSVTRTCTLESFRFSEKNVSAHPATYGYLDESSVTPKHTRAEKHVMLVKKQLCLNHSQQRKHISTFASFINPFTKNCCSSCYTEQIEQIAADNKDNKRPRIKPQFAIRLLGQYQAYQDLNQMTSSIWSCDTTTIQKEASFCSKICF